MTNQVMTKKKNIKKKKKCCFNPFRLISDEEFSRNLDAIIMYYQITKGETGQRFTSS